MDAGQASCGGILERILKGSVRGMSREVAVALVGILFENRIVLSGEIYRRLRDESIWIDLEPLEPQAGASLVGRMFGLDCDALYLSFLKDWSAVKNSPERKRLTARLETHELVDYLEAWSDIP